MLLKKIENQQALMLLFNNNDNPNVSTEKNIARLEDYRNKIRALDGDIVNDIAPMLRGWEGQASQFILVP